MAILNNQSSLATAAYSTLKIKCFSEINKEDVKWHILFSMCSYVQTKSCQLGFYIVAISKDFNHTRFRVLLFQNRQVLNIVKHFLSDSFLWNRASRSSVQLIISFAYLCSHSLCLWFQEHKLLCWLFDAFVHALLMLLVSNTCWILSDSLSQYLLAQWYTICWAVSNFQCLQVLLTWATLVFN